LYSRKAPADLELKNHVTTHC